MVYSQDTIDKISRDVNIVDYAEKYLDLEYRSGEYWTTCPFHKDDKNPSLSFNQDKNVFWCFGCGASGGIIDFVMLYQKLSFPKTIEYLLAYSGISAKETEYSDIMKCMRSIGRKKKILQTVEHLQLPDSVMDRYTKKPIKEWISEGIKPEVMEKYDVRYDTLGNRIVFPIRDISGNIISIKGRTLFDDFEERKIAKYQYYTKIDTNDFLFGLNYKQDIIQEKKEVIIAEGAKSVMFAEGYGIDNCVSLETNRINDYQINLILQLKCDVVMALDKGMKITTRKKDADDKYTYINIKLLPMMTNVYVIEDKNNILPLKASPFDCGKEIWDQLYSERIKIN